MGALKGLRGSLIPWLPMVLASWSQVQELGAKPSGRSVHAAIFDASTNKFWIQGGSDSTFSSDLWAFDFDTGTWEERQQLSAVPFARGDHVAVWDPDANELWIHGGYDGINYFNDLWRYSASTWTNILAPGPSARSQHVAVWDAKGLVIWIHGGLYDCTLNQDLWKFDTRVGTWTPLPSLQHQPFLRANHVAVWDETGQAIWIHGGYNRSCGDVRGGLQRDLWRYDTTVSSNNWNLIATGGPSARAYHVAGWDPTNRAIWLHGGFDGGAFCRDLWRFHVESDAWQLVADKEGPSRRFNHAGVWDLTRTSLCVHGGYSDGRLQNDIWCYQWTTTTTSHTISSTTTSSRSTSSTRTFTVTSTTTFSTSKTTTTSSTSESSSGTTSTSSTSSTSVTSSTTTSQSSTSTSSTTSTSTSTTLTSSTSQSMTTSSTTGSTSTSTSSSTTMSTSSSFTSSSTSTTSTSISVTATTSTSISSTTTSLSTTSSRTTSSTGSSTSRTRSSSTSSTRTSSSSTDTTSSLTRTTSTSSSATMTTSTSSTFTSTTTTPEDLTAVYILCPLLGFAIVALVILSLLYARRYCKLRRFVVLPVAQAAVPAVKYAPSPPAPLVTLPLINTQELIPPPEPPAPPAVPSDPHLELTIPELCPSVEAVPRKPVEVCISIPAERPGEVWVLGTAVSPAPPRVDVFVDCPDRALPEGPVTPERHPPGETQQAPKLPKPSDMVTLSRFVLRPIHRLFDLGPTSRLTCQKAVHREPALALQIPDLHKWTGGISSRSEQMEQFPVHCVVWIGSTASAIPSHLRQGPSVCLRAKLEAVAQATARLPGATQEPPVLPAATASRGSKSKGTCMPLLEPEVVKRKATKTCACEDSKLTTICLHVSLPSERRVSPPSVLPSEIKKLCITYAPLALSTPPRLQCPIACKPRQPLRIILPPVLEVPPRNPPSFSAPVGCVKPVEAVLPVPEVVLGSAYPVEAPTPSDAPVERPPWWCQPPPRQRRPFRP